MADIGFPDDFAPTPELRKAMTNVLKAIELWDKAVRGSEGEEMWIQRIAQTRTKAKNVYDIMTDELVFPGKPQQAAYHDAITSFLDLQNDIQFSKDTLPRPDLLDQAASFVQTLTDFPADIIEGIGGTLKKAAAAAGDALNGTAEELVKKLWPWALGLVLVIVAVEFGPTIVKAVKK